MKKLLFTLSLILVALLFVGLIWLSPKQPPANQAFINGQVLTMDVTNNIAEAVLLKHNRIVAVGSTQEITSLMPAGSLTHDLQGRSLIPGFVDAHSHFPASGVTALGVDINSPPIGDIQTIEGLLSAMKTKASDSASEKWLFGIGYDDTLLAEQRHPTKQELDSIATDQPIFILHVSGHMGVANSAALAEMGITDETPNPPGGVIEKDKQGRLTGLLQETAVTATLSRATAFSTLETLKIVKAATKTYASMGLTTAQNGAADMPIISGLRLASKLNIVPLRLELWPDYSKLSETILSGELNPASYQNDKFNIGAVKIFADGSIQGYTGFLSKPYITTPTSPAAKGFNSQGEYVGYPNLSREELATLVAKHRAHGSKLAIHGNGDAAIDNILYAVEQSYASTPRNDDRIILIHAQMARDDQLDKMRELGITPSFFSAHTYYWGDRHVEQFIGSERAARMSPTRTAIDKGLRFSVHLDTPVVPMNPMLMVWSTVNRESTSGKVIGNDQRITPMQALRATTIDSAWQIFREDEIGSIEVGKLADLVVLDGNPLKTVRDGAKQAIKDIPVVQTYVGGVQIYQRQ